MSGSDFWACPECRTKLTSADPDQLTCLTCARVFSRTDGIWRFLTEPEVAHYQSFLQDYCLVREAEGRRAGQADFYRALPERDLTGRFPEQWKIRAAGFQCLLDKVILLRISQRSSLRIADLGAGNCWLSNNLAKRGAESLAVDISQDRKDGLGCYHYYPTHFPVIQADFTRLPFLTGSCDLVIFNASLHYSEDIAASLKEALRVLDTAGQVVILDSPIYRSAGSGQAMIQEREAEFLRRFGTPSNHLQSEHFLTWERLDELATLFGINWITYRPGYGWAWSLRHLKARLLGRRELAQFRLLVGKKRQ